MNPEVTVIILRYVLGLQTFHIREGQTSEGAEDEDVAYNIQTFKCECLFHDCCQLLLGEELTVRCFGLETQSLKWIYLHPLVVKSQHDDSFENIAVFVSRVLFLFLVSAKIQMEVSDKGIVNSREREVVCFILFFDEISQITLSYGIENQISDFETLAIFLILRFENFSEHLRTLHSASKFIKNCLGIDLLPLVYKPLMDLQDAGLRIIEEIV